jgi:hypothetical protein
MFTEVGVEAYAERAARELFATGVTTVRKRPVERNGRAHRPGGPDRAARPRRPLQPRDRQPAVISPRTVEYHLHKLFAKLGISSRGELDRVLAGAPQVAV